tara:strand:- start:222 stop:500 length:279 start_codon:yes stop_codon:yes gene_type:complete
LDYHSLPSNKGDILLDIDGMQKEISINSLHFVLLSNLMERHFAIPHNPRIDDLALLGKNADFDYYMICILFLHFFYGGQRLLLCCLNHIYCP